MNLSFNRFSPRLPFESGAVLTALPLLIIASIFVWLGYIEWPGMHWDANFFAPPVVNVANGRGWHFGGYAPFYFLKLGDAYTFHGFLHIILYGVILKAGTWQRLSLLMGFVNAVTYIAYFCLYTQVLHRSMIYNQILPFILAFVPGTLALGLQGRPEQLLLLIFFVPAMLWSLSLSGLRWLLPSAIVAGLAPLASPLPGTIFCLGILLFYVYSESRSPRRLLLHLLLASIFLFLTAFLTTRIFTPLDLIPWFNETRTTGGSTFLGYKYIFGITQYKWGFSLVSPLWNLAFLFSISFAFLLLLHSKKYLVMSLLALLTYIFSARLLDYGYSIFLPLSMLICLDKKSYVMLRLPSWLSFSRVLILIAAWASLYLYVFLSYAALASGIGFKPYLASSARSELGRQLRFAGYKSNRSLVVYNGTKPSWSAVTDGSTGYVVFDSIYGQIAKNSASLALYEKSTGRNLEFYVLPQIYPLHSKDLKHEIVLDKYKLQLIYDNWSDSSTPLERFLLPYGISQDFRFALYKRVVS